MPTTPCHGRGSWHGNRKNTADARAILSVLVQVAIFPDPTEVQLHDGNTPLYLLIRLNRFFHLGKIRNRSHRFIAIYCDLLRFIARESN